MNILIGLYRFIGCILLMQCTYIYAFPDYYFKQLSLQEGLSQATVTSVLKDYKGIVWIGTRMGLNRFDQHELKNYLYDPQIPHTLPDNDIFFLKEDSLLNLWVGTPEGLTLYNRGEDNFTLLHVSGMPVQAHTACLISDGILFAGVGIYKYSYEDKKLQPLPLINKGKAISSYFTYIQPWKENLYILGTRWKGVYLYNSQTYEITPFDACKEQRIASYFMDASHNLWLSPYGKGVICYDINGHEIAHYTTENFGLTNDIVLDMLIYQDELWMATDGGGISRLHLPTKTFHTIINQTGNINSLPVNSVMCLYLDRSQNMWAGTIRGGVLNIREIYMRTFQDAPLGNIYGMSNKTSLCLYEEDGFIYIGTDGGGVNRFDPTSNTFKHYPTCQQEKAVSIAGYTKDELIVFFFSKGLYFFNKKTGECRPCDLVDSTIQERVNNAGGGINVYRFAPNKYHILADQVYIYDQTTRKLAPAQIEGTRKDRDTPIGALKVISSTDSITYLTGIKNIFRLNNHTLRLTPIYYSDYNVVLNDVCSDNKGNFWMATNRGLMRYSGIDGSVDKIATSLFNEARVAVYDPAGRIWIGAKNMLFAYTLADKRFTIFNESDGAFPNEYSHTGNALSQSGDIYLNGVTGLLRICKEYPIQNTTSPTIDLMNVQLNGVTITNQVSDKGKLSIPYDYTSLVINLIADEANVFRRKIYKFHISGIARDIESDLPTLALYALPPGTYEVSVSCSNRDGSWIPSVKLLTLTIPTPWWKSPYFVLALTLLIAIFCICYVFYYNRKKERKLQWEIKEHKQSLNEEKVRFLINMSHELCTPLMLIYAPLKRILDKEAIDGVLREQLRNICKQARQMKNLIEMVLDVRRMEMGQNVLRLSTCPLNEWLKKTVDTFKNEYENKGVRITYDLDNSISQWTFDVSKCEIIISNLLMNALKFSPEGSNVTLSTRKEENHVRISISDEGPGLDEQDLQQLFVRFYQGKHSKGGNGIGLSYVKSLVEFQGGKVDAFNNEKAGTTFYFELPETDTEKQLVSSVDISLNDILRFAEREELQPIDSESFDTQSYSILIVEDNIELCNFLKDALKEYFQKIYTANNGKDALTLATQRLPDIIVTDIMMQRGDGLEFCQRLKKEEETCFIPIILLTARTDAKSMTTSYQSGADAYLTKPFEIEELMVIVRNQLKIRKQLQMHYRTNGGVSILTPKEKANNANEIFAIKLNKIIIDNLSNNQLDADFIAEQMNMSRTSLYNKVKVALNVGLIDYVNNLRIERALQMLRETKYSIFEISEAVGFCNQRYFSTFFKKMVGCTPTKYREENFDPTSLESTTTGTPTGAQQP
ncbi:ATP-binding protein [Bacteroides sp.]